MVTLIVPGIQDINVLFIEVPFKYKVESFIFLRIVENWILVNFMGFFFSPAFKKIWDVLICQSRQFSVAWLWLNKWYCLTSVTTNKIKFKANLMKEIHWVCFRLLTPWNNIVFLCSSSVVSVTLTSLYCSLVFNVYNQLYLSWQALLIWTLKMHEKTLRQTSINYNEYHDKCMDFCLSWRWTVHHV